MHDQAESLRERVKTAFHSIVCIGASTGGPGALARIMAGLTADVNVPLFIVQHMPAGFTKFLAQRLNTLTGLTVKEAEDGETAKPGMVYIAPGDRHMTLRNAGGQLLVSIDQSEPKNGHRPSVDKLLESAAAIDGYRKIAVILTGMGVDGVAGLKALKAGGNTFAIAESEKSAAIFGMPGAVIRSGLADDIVHVDRVAKRLEEKLLQAERS
ncbi:MAG TPA: CheB methylesterase domain-containing protein [Bacillales bacterium]|nr:CheB methylesterase domain-containing protein [Bacillales bacterium]